MTRKPKPAPDTPPVKAAKEFQALFDSMLEAATPEVDAATASISRAMDLWDRGDWKGGAAELKAFDAHWDAAMASSAKGKPIVKRASAAGKRSGKARRLQGNHAKLQARYLELIAQGRPHLKARPMLQAEFDHLSRSQIDRIISNLKK